MATILLDKERQVIPRWRDFRTTVSVGELRSTGDWHSSLDYPDWDFLGSKVRDWSSNKTLPHATDVVSAAFVVGKPEVAREAAGFLLAHCGYVPPTAKSLAYRILNPISNAERFSVSNRIQSFDRQQIQAQIHFLRARLKEEPRNTIAYVDLARLYTLLDQIMSAKRAIEIALKLDSTNRFVLRSAARFFIHANIAERAYEILRRSERTKHDPWLMAAEVAVASGLDRGSRFAKSGQRMIWDTNYEPLEVTELASAIATLELKSGRQRDARKLFRKALISPTENTVAQVEWASRRISGLDEVRVSQFGNVPRIYEAQAWEYYSDGNWNGAINQAWNWLNDQPFSSRPVALGSYLASTVMGDYEEGIRILKRGRIANPEDPMILNNLAFAYASIGRINEAQKAFDLIDLSSVEGVHQVVVTATKGLLAFRSGNVIEGRFLYLNAIENASKYFKRLKIMASIYYAREELLARTTEAEKAKRKAFEYSEEVKSKDVRAIVERELGEKTSTSASVL